MKKPAKKKKMKTSTVGTMMNMGGLKMGGMTNNMSYAGGKSSSCDKIT